MSYVISISTLIAIYAMLAVSLSLLVGHTGIFSLAHAAIFGVGAYTAAALMVHAELGFVPAAFAAIVVSMVVSAAMALPSLRVVDDYFVVASLAMQFVVGAVLVNWDAVTGGVAGLPGIPRPELGSFELTTDGSFLILVLIVALVTIALCALLVRSPFGRMLHAVRDDQVVAATLGKPIARTKVIVTVFSGAVAGLAGVLYAQYLLYINPASFALETSIVVMTMVVIGGMTSVLGSAFGAAVIILIPEGLALLDLSDEFAASLEQILFGLFLVVFLFIRPQGLLGRRRTLAGLTDDAQPQERLDPVPAKVED